MKPWLRLLRPHHWVKNGFVLVPLFFSGQALDGAALVQAGLAFVSFCLLASAGYVFNDLRDRRADALNPRTRDRPLASGAVGARGAGFLAGSLAMAGAGLALALGPAVALPALGYMAVSAAYTRWLRDHAILDVLTLSAGFVLRVMAGAGAVAVAPSSWILIMTGLLSLFLALGKRRDDIHQGLGADHRRSLAGYNAAFLDNAVAVTLGALLVAYLVYTTDKDVMRIHGTGRLYLTAPFVVAGLLRYLQIILVEKRSGSPTEIALNDRFLRLAILGWGLAFGGLLYGPRLLF